MFLSAVLLCAAFLGYATSQEGEPTCSALGVGREADNPLTGVSLDVCQTDADQCCTQSYLNGIRGDLREDLLQGLKDELMNRRGIIEDIVNSFASYLEGDFTRGIRANVPAAQLLGNVESITEALTTFLTRANFAITSASPERNTTQIFVDIINQIEAAIRNVDALTTMQQDCVVEEIRGHISRSNLLTLGRSLEVLRKSFSGISRILMFLVRFSNSLDGFDAGDFPTECVNRLTELSICGRCRQRIPPLCQNSCGALVRGCFAAFYTGLQREFDNLWGVLRQLVETAAREVRELFQAETDLLDIDLLRLAQDCSIDIFQFIGRRKRQAPDQLVLPDDIMTRVQTLSGAFKYASTGPRFCTVDSDEDTFCNGGTDGDDRSCDSGEVCTSTCQCWDGERMSDTDTMEFTGSGIEEQGDNPVLRIPDDEYLKLAAERTAVVNQFLTSQEFEVVRPEEVTIPPPANIGAGGSVTLVVSMVTVLGTVLFALLIVGA